MPLNTREIEKSILGAVHEKNIDKINEVLDQITPAELNKIRPLYLGFILQSSYDEYTQRDSKKEILTKLIAFGIDPNIHGYDDPTLLNQAIREGNIECIKLLVSSPLIDLEIKNQDGLTPLSYAARIGNREIMDLLVSKGAKHDGPLPNKIPQKDLQELIDNILGPFKQQVQQLEIKTPRLEC